jgi:hypothetical protein
MPTDDDDKILQRVRALMMRSVQGRHETDEAFEARKGEVESCLKLVERLMRQYGIDRMQVLKAAGDTGLDGFAHKSIPMGRWAAFGTHPHESLASAVAEACYCLSLVSRSKHGRVITFVGECAAVDVACFLYEYLLGQMIEICTDARRKHGPNGGGGSNAYKQFIRSFLSGMVRKAWMMLEGHFALVNEDAGTELIRLSKERTDMYARRHLNYSGKTSGTRSVASNEVSELGYIRGDELKVDSLDRPDYSKK